MRRFFYSLAVAILAMLIAESVTSEDAESQAFPVIMVDTSVRNRLAEEWEPTNRYQHERGYCVTYSEDYVFTWTGPVIVYTLRSVTRAREENTTPNSIGRMACPTTPVPWVFLHVHPPTQCLTGDERDCEVGGPYAYQCFPSNTDMRTLNRSAMPFAVVQCDRSALVPYWRTEPVPLDPAPDGAHR